MSGEKKRWAIGQQPPAIVVEYDFGRNGERRVKDFADPFEARRFYVAKCKAGKNPRVTKPREPGIRNET